MVHLYGIGTAVCPASGERGGKEEKKSTRKSWGKNDVRKVETRMGSLLVSVEGWAISNLRGRMGLVGWKINL